MHRMANTRGWFLLDMLSREIGRERFAATLRSIVAEYAGEAISWSEFRSEVLARAGKDVSWFFDDWFLGTGAPEYALTWREAAGGVEGSITQGMHGARPFRASVPVDVLGRHGERARHALRVTGAETPFRWQVPFEVVDVVLDPRGEILRWTPASRADAARLAGLTRAEFERRFGSAEKAVPIYRAALDSVAEPDTAGVRFSLNFGLAAALLVRADTAAARAALEQAVRAPVRSRSALPQAYLLLARIAHARGDTEMAARAARDALSADAIAGAPTGVTAAVRSLPWFHARATGAAPP